MAKFSIPQSARRGTPSFFDGVKPSETSVFYCFDEREEARRNLYTFLGGDAKESCVEVKRSGTAILVRYTNDLQQAPYFKCGRGRVVEIVVEPRQDRNDEAQFITVQTSYDSRIMTKALKKERAINNGARRWTLGASDLTGAEYVIQTVFDAFSQELATTTQAFLESDSPLFF